MLTVGRVIRVSTLLLFLFAVVVLASLFAGMAPIDIRRGFAGILTPIDRTILFSVRLPRILFAGIVGACLSLAGVVFQGLLRNPLADPYILGISGGAAVGAIIGLIIGAGVIPLGVPILAFIGAALTVLIVFGIARTGKTLSTNTLLLAGVMTNAFFSAVILFLMAVSSNADLRSTLFWLMGDLSLAGGREAAATMIFLAAAFVILYLQARPLNLLVVGEETALQLGVPVERIKIILFCTASFVTAAAVSVCGIIGFVGLMVPHMMRMVFGSDHRLLLPAAALFGASFLAVSDTLARTLLAPAELPVGVVTALLGAPYFVFILRKGS
ncbi:MAG: iron chelate uptake ABC transporter family permease subunit [Syntrophales bacterium]|jgi:iron complex transport system permease protein